VDVLWGNWRVTVRKRRKGRRGKGERGQDKEKKTGMKG